MRHGYDAVCVNVCQVSSVMQFGGYNFSYRGNHVGSLEFSLEDGIEKLVVVHVVHKELCDALETKNFLHNKRPLFVGHLHIHSFKAV